MWDTAEGSTWLDGKGVIQEQKVKMGNSLGGQVGLSGAAVWQPIPGKYFNASEAKREVPGEVGGGILCPSAGRSVYLQRLPLSLRFN